MEEDRVLKYQQTALKFMQIFFGNEEDIIEKVDKFIAAGILNASAELLKDTTAEEKAQARELVFEKDDKKGFEDFLQSKFSKEEMRKAFHDNILKAFDDFVAGVSLTPEMKQEASTIRDDFAEIFSPVEDKNDLTSTPESLQNAVETPEDSTEPSATL